MTKHEKLGMNESCSQIDRYDRPLAPDRDHEMDREEVRVLWSFIHGDIMDNQIRHKLREHWGMCTRHAWAYAVVEVELWQSGAGKRGGHQPFDVSILYADLIEVMNALLDKSHHHARKRALTGTGTCVICDDVRGPELSGIKVTHAGFDSIALAQEANQMNYTREWLQETRPEWGNKICPDCAKKSRIDGVTEDQRCRLHLIEAENFDDDMIKATTIELTQLRQQLLALIDSMTQSGADSTGPVDASWIRAMAWFHGWAFPLSLQPIKTDI